MKIGVQFFTIRDFCKNTADLDESLKKVADIGYRHIQLSGVCPYEADWMADRLNAYGLKADITITATIRSSRIPRRPSPSMTPLARNGSASVRIPAASPPRLWRLWRAKRTMQ